MRHIIRPDEREKMRKQRTGTELTMQERVLLFLLVVTITGLMTWGTCSLMELIHYFQ